MSGNDVDLKYTSGLDLKSNVIMKLKQYSTLLTWGMTILALIYPIIYIVVVYDEKTFMWEYTIISVAIYIAIYMYV